MSVWGAVELILAITGGGAVFSSLILFVLACWPPEAPHPPSSNHPAYPSHVRMVMAEFEKEMDQ